MPDQSRDPNAGTSGGWALVVLAWLAVGVPMAWGVWSTFKKALILFR